MLFQVLWCCKTLAKYWHYIFQTISERIKIPLQISPEMTILNLGIEDIPFPFKNITVSVLMRHWRSPLTLAINGAITQVHQHYTYEKMFALASNSGNSVITSWKPWIDWYERQNRKME